MQCTFPFDHHVNQQNIHVDLQGRFDVNVAKQLLEFLRSSYTGTGNVFVNSAKIDAVSDGGVEYFKEYFSSCCVPVTKLFIKGEHGFSMGPNGAKVLIHHGVKKTKKCGGNCANCKCGDKALQKHTHTHKHGNA